MQILLASAKTMRERCPDMGIRLSVPRFQTQAESMARDLSRKTGEELSEQGAPQKVTDFWRPLLTETLIEATKADDGVLLYLDTEEFRRLFDWKRVESQLRVIEPRFHVLKNGRMTTPSVWAKTCRGAMARFVVENRISDVSQLQSFSYEGFEWCEERSCFLREL